MREITHPGMRLELQSAGWRGEGGWDRGFVVAVSLGK